VNEKAVELLGYLYYLPEVRLELRDIRAGETIQRAEPLLTLAHASDHASNRRLAKSSDTHAHPRSILGCVTKNIGNVSGNVLAGASQTLLFLLSY